MQRYTIFLYREEVLEYYAVIERTLRIIEYLFHKVFFATSEYKISVLLVL